MNPAMRGIADMSDIDFDVIVVGSGVVGVAVARACAMQGMQVLILEVQAQPGSETSSRNSEVIHAGLYYPPGSLKATLCVRGRHAIYEYCVARGIPHRKCGKLVIATEAHQHPRLKGLYDQAVQNGVGDLVWLSPAEISELEPNVACSQAFLSPSTGIIDSHALLLSLIGDVEAAGGWIALRTEMLGAVRRPGSFQVSTRTDADHTTLNCRWLINSAGLHAVTVARRIAGLDPRFIPRAWFAKGHYFAVPGRPFSRLVYPLPSEAGLGIHATVQLDGRVRFGPDVEWIDALNYDVDGRRVDEFYRAIRAYWPDLPEGGLQPAYSGIRPKISGPGEPSADFLVSNPDIHGCPGLINLFGIESPGLTAALALGEHVCASILRS